VLRNSVQANNSATAKISQAALVDLMEAELERRTDAIDQVLSGVNTGSRFANQAESILINPKNFIYTSIMLIASEQVCNFFIHVRVSRIN